VGSYLIIFLMTYYWNFTGVVEYDLLAGQPRWVFLQPGDTSSLRLNNIAPNITHVVVQSHSQWTNLSLSESADNSILGSNVGLLTLLTEGQTDADWTLGTSAKDETTVLVLVSTYTRYGML
jgi:hypothetical protein